MRRRLLDNKFLLVKRIQLAAHAKQAGGVNGSTRDEAAAKNENYEGFDEKNTSKGRMDAENRWWVAELLAADCEKALLHQKKKKPCKNGVNVWRK